MKWLERLADSIAKDKEIITRDNGDGEVPLMTRWALTGTLKSIDGRATFLHRFHRSDLDVMHDHPWSFTSLILFGGYWEISPARGWAFGSGPTRRIWCNPGRLLRRPAEWIHRVELPAGRDCWTIVWHGERVRSWGFWCPTFGWRYWRDHLKVADLNGGDGCA